MVLGSVLRQFGQAKANLKVIFVFVSGCYGEQGSSIRSKHFDYVLIVLGMDRRTLVRFFTSTVGDSLNRNAKEGRVRAVRKNFEKRTHRSRDRILGFEPSDSSSNLLGSAIPFH